MSGIGTGFRVTAFALCSLLGLGGVCLMAQPQHSPLHLAGVGPSMPKIEVQEPPDPIPQKGDTVKTSAYSPNGKYLAVSTMQLEKSSDGGTYFSTRFPNPGTNATITLYDTTTWKPFQTLKTEQTTTSFCFSADSETLYSAEMDDKIYAWNVKTGMKAKSLDAKKGKCEKLVLSPNGKMLISGHEIKLEMQLPDKSFLHDQSGNFICLWDTDTDKLIRTLGYDEEALLPRTITVSPDGSTLAACYLASQTASANLLGFHGIIEWDINTGKELRRYEIPRITKEALPVASSVAFTPDGTGIVMGGGEAVAGNTGRKVVGRIWLFDRKTGKLDKTLGDERKDIIRELAMSSDGSRLYIPAGWPAAATAETAHQFSSEIQCWDTSTWKLNWVHRDAQANSHVHLSVSPHGKRILFAGDHGLKFVDSKDGKARGALLKSSD